MSASYVIEPIGRKTADRAYPLASVMRPALTPEQWRQFCHSAELSRDEEIIVASNADGYIKGLCVYAIRDHRTYGRLLDVPFLVVASAADGEGVATALVDFLRARCDRCVCSGIRFWPFDDATWGRRLDPDYIARIDHGLFMPALASAAEIEAALSVGAIGRAQAIAQFSR
jgi:hypothetical protein